MQAGWRGPGGPRSSALQPPARRPRPRARRQKSRAPPTPGSGRQRGHRGRAPDTLAGIQGVKRGRRQGSCQTRACAVCTASVLWVSAAAAAAAGGFIRPGQRQLQSPGPRAAATGADTQFGARRGAGGPAAWGRHRCQLGTGWGAGGESRAWGRGAGGAGERPEYGRRRRSGSESGRQRSWPHLRPAGGQLCPAFARSPGFGLAPVGAPDARREAFPPPGEVAPQGGQRRVPGAPAMMWSWGRPSDRAGGAAPSRFFAFGFEAAAPA